MAVAPTKRWPPVVAVASAAVLVILVLPNGLRVPQQNPTASAEYAPVPGDSDASTGANFAETRSPTSAGIGSGGQGEGILPGLPEPPLKQFDPRNKDCVTVQGVAKQTVDPLSPPCVPFFEGDNGGETYPGVTKDTIKVVFYNDLGVKGNMNEPWKPSDESQGHQASTYGQDTYLIRTIKALLRYFQNRYQTYGRKVVVEAKASGSGLTTTCNARQADATNAFEEFKPFAGVHFGDHGQCFMEELASEFQVPSFGENSDVPRARYEDHRPYVWGFFPDQESEAGWSSSFVCDALWRGGKGKAIHTDDPLIANETRKFGFVRPEGSNRGEGTEFEQLSDLFIGGLNRCGISVEKGNLLDEDYSAAGAAAGAEEAPGIMSKFKQNNVTTVICYCIPVRDELTVQTMQGAAESINYRPEWYWDHMSRMFRTIWNQQHSVPSQQRQGFGVSHHWRNPAFREQYWYQAYLAEEPGSAPNTRFGFDIYHLFLNLFQAIQAAGPNLTPETVERGMFTFNYTTRENPFVPIGGYGPYSSNSVSNYTFVDTAMAWWWDPTGTPPGGRVREGCQRLMHEGIRYFAEGPLGWPKNADQSLFEQGAPCNQDDTEIADPSPGDF